MEPNEKQIKLAKGIERTVGVDIPAECFDDKFKLSKWIDENKENMPRDANGHMIFKPTYNAVAFAESLAKNAGIDLPEECRESAAACSDFIDAHKR